jgi:hypothetical protein
MDELTDNPRAGNRSNSGIWQAFQQGRGRRLNLSEGTVKVHLHNIYQKLWVKTRSALVVLAHAKYASVSPLSHTCELRIREG